MAKPCDGSLDLPSALVAAQFASFLCGRTAAVLAVRADQLDAAPGKMIAKALPVIGAIRNQTHHALARPPTSSARDRNGFQRLGREPDFRGRGRAEANSQRNTFAVSHHHAL